jgi:cellulose synthase/poly-beta-1,6-N-acetylglucosamine synthase-like glycosyltransferase
VIVAAALVAVCAGSFLYAYVVYPVLLKLLVTAGDGYSLPDEDPEEWPLVSVSLPAYNEEAVIGDTLENLLSLDYPDDRLQIVVVSDASTDRTDEIVRSYGDRGVELVRLDERAGKTAAENAAVPRLRGDIVINTDASTRIAPGSLKPMVRTFQDPSVGVASGRDRSVGPGDADPLEGEARYVGYEMAVRDLETRLGTLVGASGCFYAARRDLHKELVPEELSRDFIAALHAREEEYRTVSVPDAVALVPRATSLAAEYRRKLRTMARGLDSLWFMREMLDPFRYGRFAWMLASHKLARWMVPATLPAALAGLAALALAGSGLALGGLAASAVLAALTVVAVRWPEDRPMPAPVSVAGYVGVSLAAGVGAWAKALVRERNPVWEPTRRETKVES